VPWLKLWFPDKSGPTLDSAYLRVCASMAAFSVASTQSRKSCVPTELVSNSASFGYLVAAVKAAIACVTFSCRCFGVMVPTTALVVPG